MKIKTIARLVVGTWCTITSRNLHDRGRPPPQLDEELEELLELDELDELDDSLPESFVSSFLTFFFLASFSAALSVSAAGGCDSSSATTDRQSPSEARSNRAAARSVSHTAPEAGPYGHARLS